jgi:hypothetical protein
VTGTAGDGETGWTWSSLAGLAGVRLGVAVDGVTTVDGVTVVDGVAGGPGVALLLAGAGEATTTAGPMTPSVSPVPVGRKAATMPAVISRAPPTARATFRMASTLTNTEHGQIRPG